MAISSKIASISGSLSKKQAALGRYILDNMFEAALMNSPRIALEAGVSEATLTRFVYTLGYKSFSDFQMDLRRETQEANPVNPFRQESYGNLDEPVYQRVFNLEYSLMAETLGLIDPAVFDKSVDLLYEADSVILAGGPTHNFISQYALNFMSIFCNDVHLVSHIDMAFISLLDAVDSKSAAIVFYYPRYPKETHKIAEALFDKKIPTIGMTDSQLSPIIPYVDYALITPQKYLILVDPITSAMAMVHALIVGVYKKNPERAKERLDKYEKSVISTDMFMFKDYNFSQKL